MISWFDTVWIMNMDYILLAILQKVQTKPPVILRFSLYSQIVNTYSQEIYIACINQGGYLFQPDLEKV